MRSMSNLAPIGGDRINLLNALKQQGAAFLYKKTTSSVMLLAIAVVIVK